MWSIGVILYVLLAGFLPFDETTIVALFAKIQSADFSYPAWFSPEVREVLGRILVADPKKRIHLKELKAHPWLQSVRVGKEEESSGAGQSIVPPLDLSQGTIAADASLSAIKDSSDLDGVSDGEGEGETVDDAPTTLDAFDFVAHCGGFAMNRLYSPLSQDSSGNSSGRKGGRFAFTSTTPHAGLYEAVMNALSERGYTLTSNFPRRMVVKASLLTPKGAISLTAQVFLIAGCSTLCLLMIRRGKGDLLEFHAALADLVDRGLSLFIQKPRAEGEAKSESSKR